MKAARVALQLGLVAALSAVVPAQVPTMVPRIWDDAALAEWATPVATLNVRPAHYSSAEYYSVRKRPAYAEYQQTVNRFVPGRRRSIATTRSVAEN